MTEPISKETETGRLHLTSKTQGTEIVSGGIQANIHHVKMLCKNCGYDWPNRFMATNECNFSPLFDVEWVPTVRMACTQGSR